MVLNLRIYPDPVLFKVAKEVDTITPEVKSLAENMVETMYARDGIGLAAPQVGHSIRLIVVDVTGAEGREGLRVLVNPVIAEASAEAVETEEGCLSVAAYKARVRRSAGITITGTDLLGEPVHIEATGLLSICLQHEIDHLNGVLFIDHISRLKRTLYDKKVKKWIREKDRGKKNA